MITTISSLSSRHSTGIIIRGEREKGSVNGNAPENETVIVIENESVIMSESGIAAPLQVLTMVKKVGTDTETISQTKSTIVITITGTKLAEKKKIGTKNDATGTKRRVDTNHQEAAEGATTVKR